MPPKSSTVDPARVKGWIADARKKPISFALLQGSNGLVLEADKVKSPEQMRKAAKSAGGGGKGCWGMMSVQQKTLVLTYEGNPPGGLDKQFRKFLSDAGQAMQVEMHALSDLPADAAEEAPAEEEASGTGSDETGAEDAGDGETLEGDGGPENGSPEDGGDLAGDAADGETDGDGEGEEDGEEEPSDLPATIKLARKRPLNFACMLTDSGVVLITHRLKQHGILVKQAKAAGASAKGAWGTMTVESKTIVLTCLEDPPGTLARRFKLHLREQGLKFAVAIRSPSGETLEPEDDLDDGGAGPTSQLEDGAPQTGGDAGGGTADDGGTGDADAQPTEAELLAARKAYVNQRFTEISAELALHHSKKEMLQFKPVRAEIMKALKSGDLDTAQRLTASLFQSLKDVEHRTLTVMETDLHPDRAAELEKWVQANFMAEEGGVGAMGVNVLADEVGGDRLAGVLKGTSDLGELTQQEKDYITLRTLRKWVHTPGTGEEGADENIRDLTAAMQGADEEDKLHLAKLYWKTHTENMMFKIGEDTGLDTHPAFEKRDLSMQLMESTIELAPKEAAHQLSAVVGGQGLAQLATGQFRKQAIGGANMVWQDYKNPYFDAFSEENRRTLIEQVSAGALGNIEQSDAFMSFMFGAARESALEDPAEQAAWSEALSNTLGRNNCLTSAVTEETQQRLQSVLATEGGRELLFNDDVPVPMRNWALNNFAQSPADWTRQPWTAEDVAEGWESETVSKAYAQPILDAAAKSFPQPVAFDLKTQEGDLARNFAMSFGIPPNLPYKDGETKEQYQKRLAATDPDKLYDRNLPPLKTFFENIDTLEAGGASEAKITPIPITFTSNDDGAKVLKVIRLETDKGPLFFDHLNNRYRDVKHWLEENKLPEGKVTFPGELTLGNPAVTKPTPGNKIAEAAMAALDVTVMAVGTVAGVAAMAGTGGAATPLVVAGLAALYGAGRAGGKLADKHDLGQDTTDLADPEVRGLWLELGSSALSIGALGGGMRATSLIAKGTRMSKAGASVVAGMTVAGNLTDAVAMGDSIHQLEKNWARMSPEQKQMAVLQLGFQVGMHGASAKAGGGKYSDSFNYRKTYNQLEYGTPYNVTPDPDLAPGAVMVKYDPPTDKDPYPSGFRIVYGGDKVPNQSALQLHSQAASAMEASATMQKKYKTLYDGDEPPAGSAAWEAQFELTKIQGEANLVLEQLKRQDLTDEDRTLLQSRMDELNGALIAERARLDAWENPSGTVEGGRGFVAAPSGGETQRQGKGWPKAPNGYHWVASPDGTPFVRAGKGATDGRLWYDPDKNAFVAYSQKPSAGMRVVGHGDNEMSFMARGDGKTAEAHAVLRKYHVKAERGSDELAAQKAVGAKGEDTDDAGHMVGHRFGLDQGMDNLFPQDSNFNRGAYKKMENEFADWIAAGGEVRMSVTVDQFKGDRPDRVSVSYEVVDPGSGKVVHKRRMRFSNDNEQEYKRVSSADIRKTMDAAAEQEAGL